MTDIPALASRRDYRANLPHVQITDTWRLWMRSRPTGFWTLAGCYGSEDDAVAAALAGPPCRDWLVIVGSYGDPNYHRATGRTLPETVAPERVRYQCQDCGAEVDAGVRRCRDCHLASITSNMPPCAHCRKRVGSYGGGLCYKCQKNARVRALYPVKLNGFQQAKARREDACSS